MSAGDWERPSTHRTTWAVSPAAGCWVLLLVCVRAQQKCRASYWGAVLFAANGCVLQLWCADGEVSTAANLNLYGTTGVCLGGRGESKLIVSRNSFGSLNPARGVKAGSCWLHHGDLLGMDGECHDEFVHCTSPGLVEGTDECKLSLGETTRRRPPPGGVVVRDHPRVHRVHLSQRLRRGLSGSILVVGPVLALTVGFLL